MPRHSHRLCTHLRSRFRHLLQENEREALEMGLEALEMRHLLAGTVDVSVQNGDLMIVGDIADNSILVTETGGIFNVTGLDGTTVVGGSNVAGVIGNVAIMMGDGVDVVELDNVNVDGDLSIDNGKDVGRTTITDSTVGGDLSIEKRRRQRC